jgi:SAM-dependent methyltransferase
MNLPRKLFYAFFYLGTPRWDTGVSPPELMTYIRNHPSGRALDMGCGTGTNVITLVKHGWQVTGIDFIGRAIKMARRKAEMVGVQADFRLGDVTRIKDIHGPFDLVLDIGCFHSLGVDGKIAYLHNLERLLAPNGAYLMYAFLKRHSAAGAGLLPSDIELLENRMELLDRQDGSESGRLPSAWFTYRLKCFEEEEA